MTEPEAWSANPDDWPHTPPLAVYRELEGRNPGLFWRMSQGHAENLLDYAIDQLDTLAAQVRDREAAAWDEGREAGYVEVAYEEIRRNPYREGTTDE